jgi:hypothetical protein
MPKIIKPESAPTPPSFKQNKRSKPKLGLPDKRFKPSLNVRNESRETADILGLDEDNAVMKMLRSRAKERDAGRTPYKKGGVVKKKADGCAQRGRTKTRYV